MNPSNLNQLRILVERAVRPVQAMASRKQKMREELLAHVTAVFEEEAAKPADDGLALERTAERFGNPVELTGRLQESVPASDRGLRTVDDFFAGTGASTLRLALRYASFMLVPAALALTAFYFQGRMAEWPMVVAWPVMAFVSVFLVVEMHAALFGPGGRSWRKTVLVGVAAWLFTPSVTFAVCLALSGDGHTSLRETLPHLPVALLTPAVLILTACWFAADARKQQEWKSLRIE